MKRCSAFTPAFTFALLVSALSSLLGCDSGPGEVGDECDLAEMPPCVEGLVCEPDAEGTNVCQIPPGGPCSDIGEAGGCLVGSTCQEYTDRDGTVANLCVGVEGGWCDPADDYCGADLACARIEGGDAACYPPVRIRGNVFDSTTTFAIGGAHLIGINDERFAVTDVAISNPDGTYELLVAAPRTADGAPASANYTLRADADGYQTFPSGIRQPIPINVSLATQDAMGIWVVETAVTDVALIPLADTATPRFSISGTVLAGRNERASVLAVAEGGGSAYSGISDLGGLYTIFNVPAGSYTVSGYKADIELVPANTDIATADAVGVDLLESDDPTTVVSGSLQIVNPEGGTATSVVLIVESTFDDTFVRGEVPSGLRAPRAGPPDVTGAWEISGVPDGRYVVLASLENDDLIRDPDLNIAGTQIVTIEVTGGDTFTVDESFKVTGDLAVLGPGVDLPEAVTAPLTLSWNDDASAAFYTVRVYDAYGELVWEIYDLSAEGDLAALAAANIPPSSSDRVEVMYEGPLDTGMYYQFRALSWRAPGGRNPSPISATEDLRGVFYVQ